MQQRRGSAPRRRKSRLLTELESHDGVVFIEPPKADRWTFGVIGALLGVTIGHLLAKRYQ